MTSIINGPSVTLNLNETDHQPDDLTTEMQVEINQPQLKSLEHEIPVMAKLATLWGRIRKYQCTQRSGEDFWKL